MGSLVGQVALITGCGRLKGIGRATALALAEAGADIVVTDIADDGTRNAGETGDAEASVGWRGLPSLVQEIEALGRGALAVIGDVGIKQDADRMVASAVAHFGKIDILVNNAGAPHGDDRNWTWEVPEEAFDQVLRINTKGVFLMTSAVVKDMIRRGAPGRLINIASAAGRRGNARRAVYSASKFAVIGLTQSLALELGEHGITANAVCPGPTDTARQASHNARQAGPISTAPVARLGVAGDVARTVLFLADPAADYITGQSIVVDGGRVLN